MNVYRLDPNLLGLNDPRWQASTWNEAVFAGAPNPTEARKLVAAKTGAPATSSRLPSPWLDDTLASCVWEPNRSDIPNGTVEAMNGKPLNN
jgi:hypothetical protein